MMKKQLSVIFLLFLTYQTATFAVMDSFQLSKERLLNKVYFDHPFTFYCHVPFDQNKNIQLRAGMNFSKYKTRAQKLEWEHVVPAERFGHLFPEWIWGSLECVDKNGRHYRGRKCAEKENSDYRIMQADMYNLYPAVGAINAMRQNYPYRELEEATFVSQGCDFKIKGKEVEPPLYTRGAIARTYFYFEDRYPLFKMNDQERNTMTKWNGEYPVDDWECTRACRIEKIQQTRNQVVYEACQKQKLWNCD